MATYASYKKLTGEELTDGSVDGADLASPLNTTYGVKWFYVSPGACTPGCCCLWTVPAGVKKLHIQIWGAGGNGAGGAHGYNDIDMSRITTSTNSTVFWFYPNRNLNAASWSAMSNKEAYGVLIIYETAA